MSNADPFTPEQSGMSEAYARAVGAIVLAAYEEGFVITVETEPRPDSPLAMGNYRFSVTARKRREMAPPDA